MHEIYQVSGTLLPASGVCLFLLVSATALLLSAMSLLGVVTFLLLSDTSLRRSVIFTKIPYEGIS